MTNDPTLEQQCKDRLDDAARLIGDLVESDACLGALSELYAAICKAQELQATMVLSSPALDNVANCVRIVLTLAAGNLLAEDE